MKKALSILAIVAALSLVGAAIYAACGGSMTIANFATGYQDQVPGTLGTNIIVKYWQAGAGAANNSGTETSAAIVTPYAANQYYVFCDWANGGVVGCALAGRTVLLYNVENGGTGQYLLASCGVSGGGFDFDAITNGGGGGNVCTPVSIPAFTTVAMSSQDASYYYYDLTWPAIANRRGQYDVDPGADLITGIAVRTSTTPANHATSSWSVASLDTGAAAVVASTATTARIRLAKPIAAATYVSLTLLFDGATTGDTVRETAFVGAASLAFGPTAAPVFSTVAADASTVTWTSGTETRVSSYQVYWSTTANGAYQPTGLSVAAMGDNQTYSTNYRVLTTASTYYVKVKASKTDGTSEWSAPVQVSKTTKTGTRIR